MNRIVCVTALYVLFSTMSAVSVLQSLDSSFIRVSQEDTEAISLELSIQALERSEAGAFSLPEQFSAFQRQKTPVPTLVVHVQVADTGDYECEYSGHITPTGIRSGEISGVEQGVVTLGKPYWFRNLRGIEVYISPILSKAGEWVVYDQLSINLNRKSALDEGKSIGPKTRVNPYFAELYKQHFINYNDRYADLSESGSMAVICPRTSYDVQIRQFYGLIQPWVAWKNQLGIPTRVYSTEVTGETYEEIQTFIQGLYDQDPDLTFVQLVGDFAQVPCKVATLFGNTGGMDAYYSLLHGDDWYPDIFVGRFSAETAAELYTQIKRSMEYEQGITSGAWLSRAAGACSSNPPLPGDDDEHNWEHLDNLRSQLLDYGYTQVDRIYANEGANTNALVNSLNSGISLLNYCGEGYPSHWVAPAFSVSDAENLTNAGMLPFIHCVSCWTGQFYDGTCLAEAFMRSRDPSAEEARGAIAIYAAAPEQGIAPPMEAQDHTTQLLVAGTKGTIGGLCYNGAASMIDAYGENGAYNFLAWNLFGDVSLSLRTKPAVEINAVLPNDLPAYYANLSIDAGAPDILVSVSKVGLHVVSAFSGADGIAHLHFDESPQPGERYLLTLSGFNCIPLQRNLLCIDYNHGATAVLDLQVMPADQLIEAGMEVFKTVLVTNRGQITAQNVRIDLISGVQTFSIVPIISYQIIDQILPGEIVEVVLSYEVSKGIPDLASVNYTLWLAPYGGEFAGSDVVHAPTLSLESITRSPQLNWIKPGDTFTATFTIKNSGSVAVKDLSGILSSHTDYLQIVQQDSGHISINPGCTASIAFTASVLASCPENLSILSELSLDAVNALGDWAHTWKVTSPAYTVESFESSDLQTFPWRYSVGHWDLVNSACDGAWGLISQTASADSVWLELSFYALQAGMVGFHYCLWRQPECSDAWQFRINNAVAATLEDSNTWRFLSYPVEAGLNTIRWLGIRSQMNPSLGSNLLLDVIQIPYRTFIENASLAFDAEQITVALAPGEIRTIPLELSTPDGKFIQYSAVLQAQAKSAARSEALSLSCNKSAFQAGTEEWFMFTLYNTDPASMIKSVSLRLPEGVFAAQVTHFSMPGQASLPFSGFGGDPSLVNWDSASGSMADSLRCGVRLATDVSLPSFELYYQISGTDSNGKPVDSGGVLPLLSTDLDIACARLVASDGEIHDRETGLISLRANQNLMSTDAGSYILSIFYNGNRRLNIPVEISYNSDPPGYFDAMHLVCYPNPCFQGTTFAYAVPKTGNTEVAIYNLRGQRIRSLVNAELDKGYYRAFWDATDALGRRVANGIYFCRLSASNGKCATLKCVVLK